MTRLAAAKVGDIPAGKMKIVDVDGIRVALCNVEGKFYAIEDVCTHDDGPLGEGALDGKEVVCPRHGGRFDVQTGAATRMPALVPVRSFPVTVEKDSIFIEAGK